MKKYAIGVLTLALTLVLFTGCGCSNSKPNNTQPTTLPPTTEATIMPTTEAPTAHTTAATTAPTTVPTTAPNAGDTMTDGMNTENTAITEAPTNGTESNGARNRMPGNNGK